MKELPKKTRYNKAVRVGDTARVTFSTKVRRAAPMNIRARIELFGALDCTGKDAVEPYIVCQAEDSSWITWESKLKS